MIGQLHDSHGLGKTVAVIGAVFFAQRQKGQPLHPAGKFSARRQPVLGLEDGDQRPLVLQRDRQTVAVAAQVQSLALKYHQPVGRDFPVVRSSRYQGQQADLVGPLIRTIGQHGGLLAVDGIAHIAIQAQTSQRPPRSFEVVLAVDAVAPLEQIPHRSAVVHQGTRAVVRSIGSGFRQSFFKGLVRIGKVVVNALQENLAGEIALLPIAARQSKAGVVDLVAPLAKNALGLEPSHPHRQAAGQAQPAEDVAAPLVLLVGQIGF